MSRVSGLYRLQEIDLELDELNVRLDEIETILQDSSETRRLERELTESEEDLLSLRNAAQSAEHAVKSQREKIARTEARLYGGQVQNPKELQDLQAEAESLKRYLETLEDRYLEAMLEHDEAQQAHDRLEGEYQQVTAQRSATHDKLVDERARINQRQADLRAEREAAAATVLGEDQQLYSQLRARLGGIAVARLREDACSECGLALSAATQQVARAGNELVRCSQCRRLLYGG